MLEFSCPDDCMNMRRISSTEDLQVIAALDVLIKVKRYTAHSIRGGKSGARARKLQKSDE